MTIPVDAKPEQTALDAVDWLAALWDMGSPGPSHAVNAHFTALVALSRDVRNHDAAAWVERERRTSSRDHLVKKVVSALYAQADRDNVAELFRRLCTDVPQFLGPHLYRVVREARAEAQTCIEALVRGLDPVGDVAEITREPLPMRLAIGPSLFLPPPPSGRHGVLVYRRSEAVAHLYFGFPLKRDPQDYNITRAWIMGGGWHYGLRLYMDRHWPVIARRLSACSDLAEAVSALVDNAEPADDTGCREPPWIRSLEHHLHLTLKSLLCRRHGQPADTYRMLAELRGYALYPWFDAWLAQGLSTRAPLSDVLATLPESLRRDRSDWEALAVTDQAPTTINFAFASRSARRAVLVFPDAWSESAMQNAAAGWRFLPMRVARYSEWMPTSGTDAAPVIAVGEPVNNALVRTVLDQRGLKWPPCPSDNAAVVALSTERVAEATWCIAVAVSSPETAATLRAHTFIHRFNTYVLFDRGVVIGDNRPGGAAERNLA
jgi:hypothetical protein